LWWTLASDPFFWLFFGIFKQCRQYCERSSARFKYDLGLRIYHNMYSNWSCNRGCYVRTFARNVFKFKKVGFDCHRYFGNNFNGILLSLEYLHLYNSQIVLRSCSRSQLCFSPPLYQWNDSIQDKRHHGLDESKLNQRENPWEWSFRIGFQQIWIQR